MTATPVKSGSAADKHCVLSDDKQSTAKKKTQPQTFLAEGGFACLAGDQAAILAPKDAVMRRFRERLKHQYVGNLLKPVMIRRAFLDGILILE